MLTPSERRVAVALLCWLASGIALDAVLLRRPRTLVPWLGPERAREVEAAGQGNEADPTVALVFASSSTKPHPQAAPKRGRSLAYDQDGRLDLNVADSTELVLLPGVGPSLAGRILAARASQGRFRSPKDLLEVRGIGPKTLAKLLPKVVVRTVQDSLAVGSPSR